MKTGVGTQIVQENAVMDSKAVGESLLGVFNTLSENVLLNAC